jgi:hypothetical protein
MPDKPVSFAIAQPSIQKHRGGDIADRPVPLGGILRQHRKSRQHASHRITAFCRLTRQGGNCAGFLQLSLLIEGV